MRVAKRVDGAAIATSGDVKLIPGGAVELVNLSETGALVETTSRLVAGIPVTLCIGGQHPQRLAGRTVRCQVCAIHRDNTMSYQIAIAFDAPASIAGLSDEPDETAVAVSAAATDDTPEALVNEW